MVASFPQSDQDGTKPGYRAYDVYRECAKRATLVHKTKAGKRVQRFYSPKRKVSLGKGATCQTYHWSNLNIKYILSRLLCRQNDNDPPFWQLPDEIGDEYKAQMDSERRVNRNGKWNWEPIGPPPNHYWDCKSMQVTAAVMQKIVGAESDSGGGEAG